ncbi:hypothetical protein, partial [Pseudomonas sp. zfem002]|uniref:hypothetical protein n=1 Tax=Pseudomonas sp. zfem002 TaxID=3078197 RepID=UPI0029281850
DTEPNPTASPRYIAEKTKADNPNPTGHGTLQQMWERIHPRCAARAALDLEGAIRLKTGTWRP